MRLRLGSTALTAVGALVVALAAPSDASACGGCFHPDASAETTVVTAHRMAFSISTKQTVLWDQVQYMGNPTDFAWVLPVKPGARLELSTAAWFEALDGATSTRVIPPQLSCQGNFGGESFSDSSGCSCGPRSFADAARAGTSGSSTSSGFFQPPSVTVVHQENVGPYETVTLHADKTGVLTKWLKDHGYAVDATIAPVVDAYEKEGFDFIALRLQPGSNVQEMKPVRVVQDGAVPTLPLRMVAAGTGANVSITLFIVGEGRWEAKGFPNQAIDPTRISWDFNVPGSDYASVRKQTLETNQGRTWLTSFANQGALFEQLAPKALQGQQVQYTTAAGVPASTIADLYVRQAFENGETDDQSCLPAVDSLSGSTSQVVETCHPSTGTTSSSSTSSSSSSGQGGQGGAGQGGAATGGAGQGGAATGGSGQGGAATGGSGQGGAAQGGAGQGGAGQGGAGGGETCDSPNGTDVAADTLACGKADDLRVAMNGLHPHDVWITRLEAALPKAALSIDLGVAAASKQTAVEGWMVAGSGKNPPCAIAANAPPSTSEPPKRGPGNRDLAAAAAMLTALASALLRRAKRAPQAKAIGS